MVLCPPQVDSSSAPSGTSVAELSFRNLLGLNQQTYERLKASLSLGLRRQIFIAVCDDLPLRDRLALQLQSDLAYFAVPASDLIGHAQRVEPQAIPKLVTLELNLYDPNPIAHVLAWLQDLSYRRMGRRILTPAFQILGIEQLTRQSAGVQNLFLSYLEAIEQQLPLIESSVILWMTQPWFRMLPEAVPEFWTCRTGVFEFIGDPMPLPVAQPERIRYDNSPIAISREVLTEPPVNPSARSANQSNQVDQTDQINDRLNNPWIPLADDLNTWYEDSDPDSVRSFYQANLLTDKAVSLELDPWQRAFQQTLLQELEDEAIASTGSAELLDSAEFVASVAGDSVSAIADQLLAVLQQLPETASASETAVHPMDDTLTESVEQADLSSLLVDQSLPLLQHIGLLQQQIELLQQDQASPVMLANAYRTLGNFYRDCIEQGEASVEQITIAIQTYEQALQWLPEGSLERAETLNDLGSLYWIVGHLQTGQETVAYLQQSIHLYQIAQQGLNCHQHHALYASIQNNLGATYADLAQYQESHLNLQRSIEAYQQVLQYRTAEVDPLRYAATQNNLGTTFWNLAQQQEPAANLRQAIHAYSEALCYHDPTEEPLNYAMIQSNLGTAYWNLAQYDQPQQHLRLALAAYETALQYRPFEVAPSGFAATQNNLGTAYWHLVNYTEQAADRITYLQQAIAAYALTLKAVESIQLHSPEVTLNFDPAATHNNLGSAYIQLAQESIDRSIQSDYLDAALQHHMQAFQGWRTNPELQQVAFNGILQTVRAFYTHCHLRGQNRALSQLPSNLLPQVLAKL